MLFTRERAFSYKIFNNPLEQPLPLSFSTIGYSTMSNTVRSSFLKYLKMEKEGKRVYQQYACSYPKPDPRKVKNFQSFFHQYLNTADDF